MFSASLFKPVEGLVNRGIEQSNEAAQLCEKLDGSSMSVSVNMPPLRVPLHFSITANDGRIYISGDPGSGAHVEISGTLIDLSRMMFSESQRPLRAGRVQISGSADIAEQFRILFLLARPNLEEELAELVGDEAAPRIANALRNIRNFAVDTLEDVAAQVSGYLQGDGNHFPARVEIETFFNNVDELSNDLARIEARLSRIRKKLKKHDQDED